MRRSTFLAFCLICSLFSFAQKKIIVVIGSSTAAGTGASPIDSSWVNLAKAWYQKNGQLNMLYNLAVGGTTTYAGMPNGFVSPGTRPTYDPNSNVTKALSLKADVVLVNFPSNDIADGYTLTEMLFNLRTIYKTVTSAHKICYITTSQPRDNISKALQMIQKQIRDSILTEFPGFSLNFYNPIVGSDSLDINKKYGFGDGIHVNDMGHQLLYQVVKNNVLLSVNPLALALTDFSASMEQNSVLLHWTIVNDPGTTTGSYLSEVQRSADGSSFTSLHQEQGLGNDLGDNYSWTDQDPLPGRSFYRIRIIENGKETFSRTLSLLIGAKELAISRIYATGNASLIAEIGTIKDDQLKVAIISTSGMLVRQQSFEAHPPSTLISMPIADLTRGQYFIKITAANGQFVTRPFLKF
ncbi:MAG TPA: SGNH/GDSL hydrolase family protein [Puia sp.]|nr:SGNH/GDSL hydrolase family protein [Puia sp.]